MRRNKKRTRPINIFPSQQAAPTLAEVTDNYIDDMNRNYSGPPASELDRMAAEEEAAQAASNNKSSAVTQRLTVYTLRKGDNPFRPLKEDDFPLSLESLYVKCEELQDQLNSLTGAHITVQNHSMYTEKKLNKLLRKYSWLLTAWVFVAVLFAGLLAINLNKLI